MKQNYYLKTKKEELSLLLLSIYHSVSAKPKQNDTHVTIDITKQPKGIYFIQLTDENKNTINKKLILQ